MAVSSLERVSLEHQSLQNEPVVHVVDDDPHLLKSLRWLLESVGHKVATYESAQDFLADLDPAQPGCMLLDVRMPGMSGLELTQLLQSRNIALPVILFTGHGDVPMAVQAMKDGAFDFIEKPYNEQKLLDISCPLFDLVHSDCDGGGIGSPGTLQVPKGSGMDLATPNEDIRTTLLVDDDASILDLVRLHLRNAGIHADIACGPHDALEKLATGRYRVVVSDIDMPEMSGVELAKRIRELDPLIQVIMLTTGNAFEKLILSRVAGATDLLSKVHDLACIPAAVSEALERSRRWARLEYTEAEPTPHAPADATV